LSAWNAGDMEGIDRLQHPSVVVRAPEGWPEPGPFVGGVAVMRQWEQMREVWDADRLEPIGDFVSFGDRVLGTFIWRGAGHGPDIDLHLTGVWTIREGKLLYAEFFRDHDEALKAVGLEA
jgi:ketosteroid isomerase-like protein